MLPEINDIDFSDAAQISGVGHLLLSHMQLCGDFLSHQSQKEDCRKLLVVCKAWINKLENTATKLPDNRALTAIPYYDLLYRICYSKPNRNFVNSQFTRAFNARIHGDRGQSEFELGRHILTQISMRDRFYIDKPIHWISLIQNRWIKDYEKIGFNTLGLDEVCGRASLLLASNLYAYFCADQPKFKAGLTKTVLGMVEKYEGYDPAVWREIFMFAKNADQLPRSSKKVYELKKKALHRLSTSEQVNIFDREAFALDFDYYNTNKLEVTGSIQIQHNNT